jgi:hypothetical protein
MKKLHFFTRILNYLDDILFLCGLSVIIWMNFRINWFFGWYSVGVALILAGLILARSQKAGRK